MGARAWEPRALKETTMLDAAERRRAERRIATQEGGWFTRVGLDWLAFVTGCVFAYVAVRKGWSDAALYALAGGFLIGGSFVLAFRARDDRILAKLYREAQEREASGR
jgi:hypothetical protein